MNPHIRDRLGQCSVEPMEWLHYKGVQQNLDITCVVLIPINLKPMLIISTQNYPYIPLHKYKHTCLENLL